MMMIASFRRVLALLSSAPINSIIFSVVRIIIIIIIIIIIVVFHYPSNIPLRCSNLLVVVHSRRRKTFLQLKFRRHRRLKRLVVKVFVASDLTGSSPSHLDVQSYLADFSTSAERFTVDARLDAQQSIALYERPTP